MDKLGILLRTTGILFLFHGSEQGSTVYTVNFNHLVLIFKTFLVLWTEQYLMGYIAETYKLLGTYMCVLWRFSVYFVRVSKMSGKFGECSLNNWCISFLN